MRLTNSQKKTILAVQAKKGEDRQIFATIVTDVYTPWIHTPDGKVVKKPELVKTITKQLVFADPDQLMEFAAHQGVEYISLVKIQEREVQLPERSKAYQVTIQVNRRRKTAGIWLDTLESIRVPVLVGPPRDTTHQEVWTGLVGQARLWACPIWQVKITWTDEEDHIVLSEVLKHQDLATLKRMVRGFTNKLRRAGEHVNRLPKGAYVQV